MKTEEKVTAAGAVNPANAADIDDSESISSLISTLRERHRKNISARKKKLDKISKKYAGMTIAEINEHNMKMMKASLKFHEPLVPNTTIPVLLPSKYEG